MDRSVGPYQLGDSLGALPFGELIAVTHAARSEPLAILLLDNRLAKDYRFRGLLRLEVAHAGGVRHPAIARAIEVGEHADAPYVVVERPVNARTLAHALADADGPTRQETASLIRAIAEGLDAAHSRRLFHGVLGPASVLVGSDGGAAIVGIGLVGAVEEAGLTAVIAEQIEAEYTAPEQRSGRRAVASADAYALGVLAAALLGVQLSPAGSDDVALAVLSRQCATDPAARFPTCTAFATALAESLAGATVDLPNTASAPAPVDGGAPLTAPPPPQPEPAPIERFQPTPVDRSQPAPIGAGAPTAPAAPPVPPSGHLTRPPSERQASRLAEAPDPADAAFSVSTAALTPAMADLMRPAPPIDPIGDAIRWASDRVPAIDVFLDRAWPDGKVGPFPLGVVESAALAGLFIALAQPWLAALTIVVVTLLYGLPRLAPAIAGSERADPRATRVTGIIQINRSSDSIGAGQPELAVPDGVTLGLTVPEYQMLVTFGRPVTVERPAYGSTGAQHVVVGHELPGATVTYIAPNLVLLDVRHPDGAVIYRRSPYLGETGDRQWTPADGPLPGTEPPAFEPAVAPEAAARSVAAGHLEPGAAATARAQPVVPFPSQTTGNVTVLPIPPAAFERLKQAAQGERVLAGTLAIFCLVGVSLVWMMMGFFALFFLVFAVPTALIGGFRHFSRAFRFAGSRPPTSMVRIVGPITVTKHRANKSNNYFIHLSDGKKMRIDRVAHGNVASAGEARIAEAGIFNFDLTRHTSDGYLESQHELLAATTTFEPSTDWLLEVRDGTGATVYRQPPLRDGDLDPFERPS